MKKLLFLLFLLPLTAHAQFVTTIAGSDTAGFSGDGGPAIAAVFNGISGIATDKNGNIYIADQHNNRIRRIDPAGVITTVAGTGVADYTGDLGPAISATLNSPTTLATDTMGNLFITDFSARIRKVDPAGTITTFAGRNWPGYAGDGGPAIYADMYPAGICTDLKGNFFLAQAIDDVIRKVDTSGNISQFAGTGAAGDLTNGIPALLGQVNFPYDVCADKWGNIYIACLSDNIIRMVDTTGHIYTVAGTVPGSSGGVTADGVPATTAHLDGPVAVATDQFGNIYIADGAHYRIRMVDTAGIIHTICGNGTNSSTGDGGPAHAATVSDVIQIKVDAAQNIYFIDLFHPSGRVRVISGVSGRQSICIGATDTLHEQVAGGVWSSGNAAVAPVDAVTGVVSGLTAGTAVITYAVAGIKATAIVTVTSHPAAITGTASMCRTGSTNLDDATPGGTWSSSNTYASVDTSGYVTGVFPGTAIITYGFTGACIVTTVVTVNALPNVAAIAGSGHTICLGQPATLTDATADGTWTSSNTMVATISGSGVVNPIITGATFIVYTVTDAHACTAYTVYNLYVQHCPDEVPAVTANEAAILFPDPATTTLTITMPHTLGHIMIYNVLGQQVYDNTMHTQSAQIDVASLSQGMYYVIADGYKAGKFVKQ